MRTAKLRAEGGSVVVVLPKTSLDRLTLKAGDEVAIMDSADGITIRRARRRYTMQDLLRMGPPPTTDDDRAWLDMADVGGEVTP